MKGLTLVLILIVTVAIMGVLYQYVGPFGFLALILVAAIINIYERHRKN